MANEINIANESSWQRASINNVPVQGKICGFNVRGSGQIIVNLSDTEPTKTQGEIIDCSDRVTLPIAANEYAWVKAASGSVKFLVTEGT